MRPITTGAVQFHVKLRSVSVSKLCSVTQGIETKQCLQWEDRVRAGAPPGILGPIKIQIKNKIKKLIISIRFSILGGPLSVRGLRSEEHTSELQSR